MDKKLFKIRVGSLNRRIKIYKTILAENATGEQEEATALFKKVWASLNDVSGTEKEEEKIIMLNVRKYTVRFNKELFLNATKMLIEDTDGFYDINAVEMLGRNRFLILKCSKRE